SPQIAALYDAAKKEGTVSWWDQHDPGVAQKFMDAFKKEFPGVDVEFFEGTQDVLKARSIQEARAGKLSFDFIHPAHNFPSRTSPPTQTRALSPRKPTSPSCSPQRV